MELFTNVWGAGAVAARSWIAQGFRSLKDIEEHGNPTAQQKVIIQRYCTKSDKRNLAQVGLARYDDILLRMPRSEVFCRIIAMQHYF